MNADRRRFLDDAFDAFSMLARGNFVSLYDMKGCLTRYSPGAVELFNLPGEYIPDGAYSWEEHIHPEDRARYTDAMRGLTSCETLTYDITYRTRTRDGSYSLFRYVGAVIRDDEGRPSLVGGMIINEGRLEQTDSVTMLRNRNGFFNDLAALHIAGQPCVILLMGISQLPQINREFGYGYGSKILQQVAWLLQEEAGQQGVVYRMGGSRFAFISKTLTDADVDILYQKIRLKLRVGVPMGEGRHPLAASAGMLALNDYSRSDRTVFACLASVYEESKTRRDGDLVAFSRSDDADAQDRLAVLDRIRTCMADECQGFLLEYQPVYSLRVQRIIGVEALIRWRDDACGTVYPTEFMPVLEQDFAFEELGLWILRRAMTDGKRFFAKRPDFVMGVNISPAQLRDRFFPESVLGLAERMGFPLSGLCLELTRDCRQIPLPMLSSRLDALRAKGVKICIDDFGSGFGSLEFLRGLPSDYVKFDMQFVKNIAASESERDDLRFLCEMAARHTKVVCVKGVENHALREILKEMPVGGMQGFEIAPSLSPEAVEEGFLVA